MQMNKSSLFLVEECVKAKKCPECGKSDLILDQVEGELVCEQCGFVVSSPILDHGPEWSAFNAERTRVGAPPTWIFHDKGFSTTIDRHNLDAYGRRLKPRQIVKAYRLRKWQRRSKVSGSTEMNLAFALSELTKVSYKLNLPRNVVETAAVIYRRTYLKHLIKGRTIRGMAAASIYMACRQCNVIRTLEDVANAADISKKEMSRNYRFMLRRLQTSVPRTNPQTYVPILVNHLSLSGDNEIIALKILDLAQELRLTNGKRPAGMAAAATYLAALLTGERRTQDEIAEVVHVTEVTIRNRCKELVEKLNIRVDM